MHLAVCDVLVLDLYVYVCRIKFLKQDMLTQLFEVLSLDAGDGEGARERLASPRLVAQAAGRDSNLSGLEAFTFAYRVQFPLSLVFSTRAMLRYQTLFRFLFYLKHVERLLLSCALLLLLLLARLIFLVLELVAPRHSCPVLFYSTCS